MSDIIQRTLAIIKPDAVERHLIGTIIERLEEAKFNIIALKMMHLSESQASEFYKEHAEKVFFQELIMYMTQAPVVVLVLEAGNVITKYRALMGDTDPKLASPGTLRADYGLDKSHNSVHGSDSVISSRREIEFFFGVDI